MALIPPRLKQGGTIGIVTPSSQIADSPSENPHIELQKGLAYLKELGFRTALGEFAMKEGYFGAGSPQERAQDLNRMVADPEIDAIMSTHGGIFANAILPFLDYELIRRNPKILLGFSDIATLHLGIYTQTGLVTFHSNMVMYYFGMDPQEYDRQEFLDRLVHGKIGPVARNSPWRTVRGRGGVEGRLLGGNDRVIQWLLGTPYLPDFADSILFLEVPGFEPDTFYNRLQQFKQAGIFAGLRGLLLGYAGEKDGYRAEDVCLDVTSEYDFPIVKTDDFGHHCPTTVLPVGVRAMLNADTATLELLEPCVK